MTGVQTCALPISDLKTGAKKIEKALNEKEKALKSLMNKSFACEADALNAVTEFEKTLRKYFSDGDFSSLTIAEGWMRPINLVDKFWRILEAIYSMASVVVASASLFFD